MRIFRCPACEGALFFENLRCACGAEVAYDPEAAGFVQDAPFCANRGPIACNWAAPGGGSAGPAP